MVTNNEAPPLPTEKNYQRAVSVLTSFRQKGILKNAYFFGSMMHTPKPHDIDVLVISDDTSPNYRATLKKALADDLINVALRKPEELLYEMNKNYGDKQWDLEEELINLMKTIGEKVPNKDQARIFKLFGLKTALTNRNDFITEGKRLEYYEEDKRILSEEFIIKNDEKITVGLAVDSIDRALNHFIDVVIGPSQVSLEEKIAKIYGLIESSVPREVWKRIRNQIRDIYNSQSFADEIFEAGAIDLEGKKVSQKQVKNYLRQLQEAKKESLEKIKRASQVSDSVTN